MFKWILLGSGLYLLLRPAPMGAVPQGPRRIVTLGDSITAGPYPDYLKKRLEPEHTVIKMGHGGRGVKYIYDGPLWDAIAAQPTDVVLLIGVNDITSNRSVGHVTDHLHKIYAELKKNNIRVTAVPILPWGAYRKSSPLNVKKTDQVNTYIRSSKLVDRVVDVKPMAQGTALHPAYTNDKLHPNHFGAEILSDLVISALF